MSDTKQSKPRILCIGCDAAYDLDEEVIQIRETTELKYDTETFPKGKLVRFYCTKCKGETTSMVIEEDDIKNYNSPMLQALFDKRNKQVDKEE